MLETKKNDLIKRYLLPVGVCVSILSFSVVCNAADPASSMGVIKTVITNITDLIKNEGKLGLQTLCVAGGGIAAAKTVSWQPLLVGAGGAGVLEMIFQAIS